MSKGYPCPYLPLCLWMSADFPSNEFEELADECHNLAFEFFRAVGEPPVCVSGDSIALIARLISEQASLPSAVASLKNMPLSLSMSGPAEVMRCAVAEFIIGKALTDHIFVDMYFRKPDLRHAVSTMLDYLEARDSYAEAEDSHAQSGYLRREPMVRIQLLAEAETDNEARLRVINSAKRDVCDSLDHLLPSSFTRDVFHGRLEELLAQAMDLWGPLQRSKFRASAEFAVTAQLDRQDDFYTEFGGPVEGEQAEPIILLFPQISIANEIICSAKALWSDQAIVVAAKEELEKARNHGKMKKQEPPKKLMKRRLSVRQREIPVPSPGVSSGEGRPDEVKQGLIGHGKGPQSSSDVTAVVALRSKEVLSGPKT
ncbi:hypothetical protein B0T25DRAFT_295904 [Lasiosphaeria hispida]|uniref:Uncharacterized protein n=1 Tax=Lasiosphaeria hispida TaxID=260671 RepID=A0AAJ0MBG8_9PEZI|nr:hypothetical protein B0T25DRAFT_295904 [Lasiosphaeria hispida]